jgi:hypothetical protein
VTQPLPDPVDLRGLPPPEPLERILAAIAEAPPRASLRFLLSMEPLLLYGLLRRERIRYRVERIEGVVALTIERSEHKP